MPVSPQDFELYSRMTGAPMPSDAMSRMQMAPDVYKFTKDFARKPNLLEKTGNLAKNIGKGVVFALGAPMVAESMAETERMNEQLRNEGDKTVAQEVTTQEGLSDEQEKTRRKEIEIQGKKDLLELENPSGVAGRNIYRHCYIIKAILNIALVLATRGTQL